MSSKLMLDLHKHQKYFCQRYKATKNVCSERYYFTVSWYNYHMQNYKCIDCRLCRNAKRNQNSIFCTRILMFCSFFLKFKMRFPINLHNGHYNSMRSDGTSYSNNSLPLSHKSPNCNRHYLQELNYSGTSK